MQSLRPMLLSCPRWVAVAGITAASVGGSVLATVAAVSLSPAPPHWASALCIAVLIPTLVAPLCSWPVIGIMHELELARAAALRVASTDLLTGALSRRRFIEIAEELAGQAVGMGRPYAVLLMDVDDFKGVNDQHGHRSGDEVLIEVVRRCEAALRPGDHLARWGGEEFVALLPAALTGDAIAVALRLRAVIADQPVVVRSGTVRVTASLGVASSDIGVDHLERLLVMADRAMYEVKRNGKNNVMAAGEPHRTGAHVVRSGAAT